MGMDDKTCLIGIRKQLLLPASGSLIDAINNVLKMNYMSLSTTDRHLEVGKRERPTFKIHSGIDHSPLRLGHISWVKILALVWVDNLT